MPIRFRCAYCNQLLGIARRKAGTVVRCPNCAGQIVVPSLQEAGLEDKPTQVPHRSPAENNDADKALEGAAGDVPSVVQPGQGPVFASQRAGGAVPSIEPRASGVHLSPLLTVILGVVLVIALVAAFGLGLVMGLSLGGRN